MRWRGGIGPGRDAGAVQRSASPLERGLLGITVALTTVDEPGAVDPTTVTAVTGAVGEVLTNAAKHGDARRVVVFVDPDDQGSMMVSINDPWCGFDPARTRDGVGLSGSVRSRMADVGGGSRSTLLPAAAPRSASESRPEAAGASAPCCRGEASGASRATLPRWAPIRSASQTPVAPKPAQTSAASAR